MRAESALEKFVFFKGADGFAEIAGKILHAQPAAFPLTHGVYVLVDRGAGGQFQPDALEPRPENRHKAEVRITGRIRETKLAQRAFAPSRREPNERAAIHLRPRHVGGSLIIGNKTLV